MNNLVWSPVVITDTRTETPISEKGRQIAESYEKVMDFMEEEKDGDAL